MWRNYNPHALLVWVQNGQLFWKMIWQFLRMLNMEFPHNLAILLLDGELETYVHTNTWIQRLLLFLFSRPVMSDSVTPWTVQHASSLCSPPFPEVCPSSCPLHRWCHPAVSSSDDLFSFCPQSFPASGTFPMSQPFALDERNTGVSASVSVLSMSIQGWFPLRLVWSPCFPRDSQESSPAP